MTLYRQKVWRIKNPRQNEKQQRKYKKFSLHWKKYWRKYQKRYYLKHREKILAQKRERYALRKISV